MKSNEIDARERKKALPGYIVEVIPLAGPVDSGFVRAFGPMDALRRFATDRGFSPESEGVDQISEDVWEQKETDGTLIRVTMVDWGG